MSLPCIALIAHANWRHHSELLPYAVALVAIVAGLIVFSTSSGGKMASM
jgi:hypothetical protein